MEVEIATPAGPSCRRGLFLFLLVFAILLISTVISIYLDLDRRLAGSFFVPESGWLHKDAWLWRMLYDYGTIPGLLLSLTALTMLFCSKFNDTCRRWRNPMIVVVVAAVVGAGLLVNGIFKPYCGRPRPREIVEFQGQYDYCMPCFDSTPGKGMSFPCGHCTMGFVFVSLFFCHRRSKLVATLGTLFGLILGGLLGVARAAQGAHFLTDIIWALGIIVLVSILTDYVLIPQLSKFRFGKSVALKKGSILPWLAFGLIFIVILLLFMTRRPYYETRVLGFKLPSTVTELIILTDIPLVKSNLVFQDEDSHISLTGQGFATPNAREDVVIGTLTNGGTMVLRLDVDKSGYFSELQHRITVYLPAAVKDRVLVSFDQTADGE